MGRHSLQTPEHHEDTPTQFLPHGNDGADTPTRFLPHVGEVMQPLPYGPQEIARQYVSPDSEVGLGQYAVKAGIYEAYHAASGNFSKEKRSHEITLEALEQVREQLYELSEDEAKKLQKLLLNQPPSPCLMDRLGFAGEEEKLHSNKKGWATEFVDRLTRKEEGERLVPDELLLNFLEWHNSVLAERQQELDSKIEGYKQSYVERFTEAALDGWVPAAALNHLNRLKEIDVIVDDGLITKNKLGLSERTSEGHKKVIISPNILKSPQNVLDHEFTHVVEGHNHHITEGDSGGYALYRIFGSEAGGRAVTEAADEQFTLGISGGDMSITDPSHPKRVNSKVQKRTWSTARITDIRNEAG